MKYLKTISFKIIWSGIAVMILLLAICTIIKIIKEAKKAVYTNQYTNHFLADVPYRIRFSLYVSFIINLAYALVKLASGIVYHSVWFSAIAAFYIILCLIRALLMVYVEKHDWEKDKKYEYQIYRYCGILILILNLALTGVVIQMVKEGQGYYYPGILIYIAAMFTFYAVILAVYSLVKYKKHNRPAISAVNAINFTVAAVSILSLQTAMLEEFGEDFQFVKIMNSATGYIVYMLIWGTAFYMIVNVSRHL